MADRPLVRPPPSGTRSPQCWHVRWDLSITYLECGTDRDFEWAHGIWPWRSAAASKQIHGPYLIAPSHKAHTAGRAAEMVLWPIKTGEKHNRQKYTQCLHSCTGTSPMIGSGIPCICDRHGVEEAEPEDKANITLDRLPLPKTFSAASAMKPLPGKVMPLTKTGSHAIDKIGAGDTDKIPQQITRGSATR